MSYDIKIKEIPKGKSLHTEIEDLKELKALLEEFNNLTIEVEVHNLKKEKRI